MTATLVPLAPPIITARPYQREAITSVETAFADGLTRLMLALPTGAGKTIIAGYLARELAYPRGWSTVMLVHRTELVRQSVEKFGLVLPGVPVGVVAADIDQCGYPITVASVPTLLNPRRLARLHAALTTSRLVISDEAHHDAAPGRQGVIVGLWATLKVGFTATPERADGKGLTGHYEHVAYAISMLRLMAEGQLAPLTGLRIGTGTSLEAVKSRDGDFAERELAVVCNSPSRNALVVRTWQERAAGRRRTVAFCVDVQHAYDLRDAFQQAGVDAETVVGETPDLERARLLRRFADGSLPVLTSCAVLTEGYDEPGIDCILHCRPTQSRPLYIQMTGRAARRAPGKQDALIIDFVDNSRKFAIVSLDALADGEGADALLAGRKATPKRPGEGEAFDLLALARSPRQAKVTAGQDAMLLYERSPLFWQEAAGVQHARVGDKQWVVLVPAADGHVRVELFDTREAGRPRVESLVPTPIDLGYGMGVAEDAADRLLRADRFARYARRDAAHWQRRDPPTDKQLAWARSEGIAAADGMSRQELSRALDAAAFGRAFERYRRQQGQRGFWI